MTGRRSVVFLIAFITLLGLGFAGYAVYQIQIVNPRVLIELRDNPNGQRAQRVMLLTLPDAKTIPVNYLREGDQVFVGADGPWWRTFPDGGAPVSMVILGEQLMGHARAVLDDPGFKSAVFSRLRPAVPKWLPEWLNGVLVVIDLESSMPTTRQKD